MSQITVHGVVYPVDKVGSVIHVGDFIAYGHALGRCAGLRIGKVLAIKYKIGQNYNGGEWYDWRITVIGIDDDWNSREAKVCNRKGTLMYPNRILVLSRVPEKYEEMLKGF